MDKLTFRLNQTGLDKAYANNGVLLCIGSKGRCSFWEHGVSNVIGDSENPIIVVDEGVGLRTLTCRNCLEPR